MLVVATAYCSCVKCCGKSDGITASGKKAKANHTIAVDKNVIPLGTKVLINGKQYVAEDTGSAIIGNRIDIFYGSNHEQALEWGRQQIEIEVLL
jgi:3D (Asp-Asp-Asp) domain-containing protein